jgi:hypothetical protein
MEADMHLDDRDYLEKRAARELDCAQRAMHPAAVRAHYQLLGYYLNMLYPEGQAGSCGMWRSCK